MRADPIRYTQCNAQTLMLCFTGTVFTVYIHTIMNDVMNGIYITVKLNRVISIVCAVWHVAPHRNRKQKCLRTWRICQFHKFILHARLKIFLFSPRLL